MKIRTQIREGKYFDKVRESKSITLRNYIKRYLEGCTNKGINNERRYGRFWSLLLGKRLLTDISIEDCRRVQANLVAKKRLKTTTINRYFSFLRHILMLALKDNKITQNPVTFLKSFPEERRTRFLRDEEITRLCQNMSPNNWQFVAFALETGFRRSEQFRLRWDQIDFENQIITLPLPKGQKTQNIPISQRATSILRTFDSFLHSQWVFPSPINSAKPRDAQAFVNTTFSPALKKAGLQGVCWHTLRHTFASRLVMAGVDLYTVKEILGHQDIQTTMRYAHLSPSHLKEAVNKASLHLTVTTTMTEQKLWQDQQQIKEIQHIENIDERSWLGEKDSNPHSQNQNLTSYP